MEILASYDLTRCAWSAAQLVGCDPKTVQRYVDLREAGLDPLRRTRRGRPLGPPPGEGGGRGGGPKGEKPAAGAPDPRRAGGVGGDQRAPRPAGGAAPAG